MVIRKYGIFQKIVLNNKNSWAWTSGVDWRTPDYMVREEAKRDKLRTRAKRRAWRYEDKLRRGGGSEITREYLAEMGEREEEMSK